MKVNRTPYNTIPEKWAFDPELGPFVRDLLDTVWQTRSRTGGDFDQVEENAGKSSFTPPRPDAGESPGAPLPPRESAPEARIDVIGIAAARKAAEALAGSAPIGAIMLWSGATSAIPGGWQICDGTNSTPDLRDNFVVGAGSTYAVDATGGGLTDVTTVPSATTTVDNDGAASTVDVGSDVHTHEADILPPYHALAYIQRIF